MKTSVLLCTYNGSDFIVQQLDSIRNQTRIPDEVIIKDDCSTDNTVQMCKNYISENNLLWKVVSNEYNLGWKKNFFQGLQCCNGEIIFLCDQDDIWKNKKIEEMTSIMEKHPEIELLISNYDVVVENGEHDIYVRQSYKMKDNGELRKINFSSKWSYIIRPGCTYCLKKIFFDEIKKYWDPKWPHDANLFRYSILRDSLWLYQKKLICFRRHEHNQSGAIEIDKIDRLNNIGYFIEFYQSFNEYLQKTEISNKEEKSTVINKGLSWLHLRKKILEDNNLIMLIFLLKYIDYYAGINSWLADIVCIIKNSF